jgi:hypothetical protein
MGRVQQPFVVTLFASDNVVSQLQRQSQASTTLSMSDDSGLNVCCLVSCHGAATLNLLSDRLLFNQESQDWKQDGA